MQAYECTAEIDATGALHLPANISAEIMSRKIVRVLVLVDEKADQNDEHHSWKRLTTDEFLRGYSDADAIYDTL
jgi:hypothetical protein